MNAFQWLYQWDKLAPQEHIRGILGRLLFCGEAGLKQAATMSGGECARLLLAKLLVLKHNVLVLDEPTNHLDIESIEGLLDGLKCFKGTIVVRQPRPPRRLRARDAHRRAAAARDGKGAEIVDFGGTYDEFLEREGRDFTREVDGCRRLYPQRMNGMPSAAIDCSITWRAISPRSSTE